MSRLNKNTIKYGKFLWIYVREYVVNKDNKTLV